MELPSLPTIQPLPVEHVEPLKPEIEHTEVSELSDTPYVTKQGVDRVSFGIFLCGLVALNSVLSTNNSVYEIWFRNLRPIFFCYLAVI